jgi:hypothetical protein
MPLDSLAAVVGSVGTALLTAGCGAIRGSTGPVTAAENAGGGFLVPCDKTQVAVEVFVGGVGDTLSI